MAQVEKVGTFVTAVIAFTESELVLMRDLTRNPLGSDESTQEHITRKGLFLAFDDALSRR